MSICSAVRARADVLPMLEGTEEQLQHHSTDQPIPLITHGPNTSAVTREVWKNTLRRTGAISYWRELYTALETAGLQHDMTLRRWYSKFIWAYIIVPL
ncbi:hypothetical protein, partial [Parasphingorhabdus sp.]|uniref:hypothetical protein n=1 Tax=Parasphingorhabdus sp. TaxID=2709688 RepID=UPI0032996AE8